MKKNITIVKARQSWAKLSDIFPDDISGYSFKELLECLKKNDEVKFFVNKSKKTIFCMVVTPFVPVDRKCFAKVKLAEDDEWDEELGKALAYLKAKGLLKAFRNSKTIYHGEEK